MRFIGIIPARMTSTRFPGKPLTPIAGKPMLWRVARAVALTRSVYPWYVATADPEIIAACESWDGTPHIVTRADCRNGTERCHDAMRQLAMRDPDDIVVNVQCDEPLIRPESLDALCRAFTPGVNIASLYFKPQHPAFMADRNRVKVLVGDGGNALAFTRSATAPALWRLYGQHVGVYGYRRDILSRLVSMPPVGDLEQMAWMRAKIPIRMVEIGYETVAVDRPEDVAEIEKRLHG